MEKTMPIGGVIQSTVSLSSDGGGGGGFLSIISGGPSGFAGSGSGFFSSVGFGLGQTLQLPGYTVGDFVSAAMDDAAGTPADPWDEFVLNDPPKDAEINYDPETNSATYSVYDPFTGVTDVYSYGADSAFSFQMLPDNSTFSDLEGRIAPQFPSGGDFEMF
ncbi:hypothetical protein [Tateyamaria omphalii]|uniref:Uncharacterized protein n=1 Tax=Tateyamaria omphalii TaxID=299262 RepID=A0A1P8MWZ6_9RHOB|nr:hypothetical protein [Tateyamaria omphalii]APX12630.1 hypothetical protein BWR18_13755 [Tateyamaria omphalii]